ncbi:bacteriophytochrome (light-regulated signal transduction histidine kinase) [Candidatus Magnetomorum sp. HK-1]|nr:bacteriophytochrome (light-regulated signal transduction histidine kinase) [Candidatus Magnetomorum sp. HK-1]
MNEDNSIQQVNCNLSNSHLCVLLIEDNRMDAELLMDLFDSEKDIHIEWVSQLVDGIKKVENKSYDMILLDLNLPDSNGLSTFDKLNEKASDIPIIIITGDENPKQAVEAVKKGAQDYLIKNKWDASFLLPRAIRLSVERNTIRKKLLLANEQLKEKNKELDQFVYMLSHDLKVPLNSIIGFSDLLIRNETTLKEEVKDYSQYIFNSANNMQSLIEDLLAFTYTKKQTLTIDTISFNYCVDIAVQLLKMEIRCSDAKIERDSLPEVRGDQKMLVQLLQNLIGNALKYVDKKTPIVRLTCETVDQQLILGVKDNGIGISPEYFDKIFEPFKRLHSDDIYKGTGVGLAICKKIVERHNGKIWVESKPREGSHFKFYLSILNI